MREFRIVLLITDRDNDCFELFRTNAPDSVIKTEIEYFKSCQQLREECLIGKDGNYYPIITGLGYEVELLATENDYPLKNVSINKLDQVFDYSNDYVEITIYQHEVCEEELVAARNQIKELEVANKMLRNAILQLTKNKRETVDVRVSRKDFLKLYETAIYELHEFQYEDNDVYGYPVTVHWHGIYCDCSDGATPSNHIIPGILSCEEELDGEEECV